MINLLPPQQKESYRYARRNVGLRRWLVAFAIALIGLGGLTTFGLLTLQQSTVTQNKQIDAAKAAFKADNFKGTQAEITNISNSFKLVVKVLSNEVLFSRVLQQIGTITPNKVSLTDLVINDTHGGIDISATAPDYNSATQLQINLADPKNKLFSKADILDITCNPPAADNVDRECVVRIRALFATNNPFLFINQKAVKP